jgi:hypothetical protein
VSSVQMDNSSRTAVDNSVTTSTTKNISRVTVNPVPHRIILSK